MVGFENNTCNVVYSIGDGIQINQVVTQKKLSELLNNPEIFLISVNAEKSRFKRKRRK